MTPPLPAENGPTKPPRSEGERESRHALLWDSHKAVSASPYYEAMSLDWRECVRFLRDDLYRLDEDTSRYDCATKWRYAAPGRAFVVTLSYGERHLLGSVERSDGTILAATSHADVQWLDEVLP